MPERHSNARQRVEQRLDERRTLTIREVAERHGKLLLCCWRCHREVEMDPAALLERHAATVVAFLPARCKVCALNGLPYTMIKWPHG